ncbi:acyltransferase family protein [Variovorax sp. HJSM1_2]|uniref:acyltransferase family protein n=1 Tax=Variovorax sp. HJSM1_2 TaxID=3366263 RepID=UPI003BC8DBBF
MNPLGHYCGNRNNNFNLLRLIAASLVIFGHSYATLGPQGVPDFIQAHMKFVSAGHIGVQIFFVISGFLVAQSFVNRPHIVEFLTARILRIFPGLLVALIFTVLLGALVTTIPVSDYFRDPRTYDYLSQNFLLNIRWELPGVFQKNSFPNVVNGSLWTLPIEFKLYLILMIFGVAGALKFRAITNVCAMLLVYFHLQKTATYNLTGGDINVDDVVFCFLIGVLFYANREKIIISIRIAIGLILLTAFSIHYDYYTFFTLQACIAYLVFIFAYHEKLQVNIFRHADYSYGLYIYAFPLQQALAQTGKFNNFELYVTACFAVTLPFAIGSWVFIEKPALRLRDLVRKLYPLQQKLS